MKNKTLVLNHLKVALKTLDSNLKGMVKTAIEQAIWLVEREE